MPGTIADLNRAQAHGSGLASYSKDGRVISLTRLNGQRFALNPDLIERVDVTPDTVVTLIDGAKYLVNESLDDVIAEIRTFRASIVAMANRVEIESVVTAVPPATSAALRVVQDAEEG